MDPGQREHATLCGPTEDCSTKPLCTGQGIYLANCGAITIEHFTTAFNFAEKNFSALWLRGGGICSPTAS